MTAIDRDALVQYLHIEAEASNARAEHAITSEFNLINKHIAAALCGIADNLGLYTIDELTAMAREDLEEASR